MSRDDDWDDDYDDGPSRTARRVRKKPKSRRKKSTDVGLIVLRVFGYLAAAHGALGLILNALGVLIAIFFLQNLILTVLGIVYCLLVALGITGAVGGNIPVSRETKVGGRAGIVLGIVIIEGTHWGSVLLMVLIAGYMGPRDKPVVTFFNPAPPDKNPPITQPTPSVPAPAAPAVAPAPVLKLSNLRHIDRNKGYSLLPPAGWSLPTSTEPSFIAPALNGITSNLSIDLDTFSGTLNDFSNQQLAATRSSMPDATRVSQSEFRTSAGQVGIKHVVKTSFNGQDLRISQYLFEHGDRKILVTAGIHVRNFEALDGLIDSSVKTLELTQASVPIRTQPNVSNATAPPSQQRLFSTTVIGFSGNGDIGVVATKALSSVPEVDSKSIRYDSATKSLSMSLMGSSINTANISQALQSAGIQTRGVRLTTSNPGF